MSLIRHTFVIIIRRQVALFRLRFVWYNASWSSGPTGNCTCTRVVVHSIKTLLQWSRVFASKHFCLLKKAPVLLIPAKGHLEQRFKDGALMQRQSTTNQLSENENTGRISKIAKAFTEFRINQGTEAGCNILWLSSGHSGRYSHSNH